MASDRLRKLFRQVRRAGHGYSTPPGKAVCDWQSAIILRQWEALEDMGLVRLRMEWDADYEPDCDCPDPRCPYRPFRRNDPSNEYRRELEPVGVIGEYCFPGVDADGYWAPDRTESDHWEHGGSCWGFAGYKDASDWRQNDHVIGIMAETIASFALAWKDRVRHRCQACHQVMPAVA